MQAIVKTPHINLNIKGKLSTFILNALKKEYGKKLILREEEEETLDYFNSPLAKSLEKIKTPSECLKTYRTNHSLTQEQLGKKLNISKNYVSDWERGRRSISKDKAKMLSKLFHISTDNFI